MTQQPTTPPRRLPHGVNARVIPTPAAAAMLAVVAALSGCGGEPAPPERQPVAVIVAAPEVRSITNYYQYSGTTAAVDDVQVRARVAGELISQHFDASTDVEAGDLLFVIEPEPYEAALAAAEADIARAEASLELGRIERDRVEQAFRNQAATEQERLEYNATVKQREAELLNVQAIADQARIELGYTRVTAPIAGRVNRELVDVGNLVGQGEATLLTTIVTMKPMHAYFDVSEKIVQEYIARGQRGELREDGDPPPIELARSIDPPGDFPFVGRLDYVEPQVDPATGTMRVRGVFDNADGALFPGLFVRARVPYETVDEATLIHLAAVGSALDGDYVYLVGDDKKVVRRSVELGEPRGEMVVVRSGVSAGERYIVRGVQKVRPGQAVAPRPLDQATGGSASGDAPGAGGGAS